MDFVDDKYIRFVGSRLDKFKSVKPGLYNFRCPYCGDSQKHKNKARGYFFLKGNEYIFKCHNCSLGRTVGNFLKDQAFDLYDEYVMERYKKGLTGKGRNVSNPKLSFEKPVFKKHGEVQKVSELNKKHPAYEYLVKRNLDTSLFYYTDKFCTWVNTQKPTFTDVRKDHSRIIIPFIDSDGKWFGLQGRSLNPKDKMRYITIMLDENKPKIYGLDRINKTKTVYIVEGPFDSTFLDNSVAMAGSDVDPRTYNWSDYIWVYDNEPRNRQIVERVTKSIDRGEKVVIWPQQVTEKDINDMILRGIDPQSIIKSHTYQGIQAKIKLNEWKRV